MNRFSVPFVQKYLSFYSWSWTYENQAPLINKKYCENENFQLMSAQIRFEKSNFTIVEIEIWLVNAVLLDRATTTRMHSNNA